MGVRTADSAHFVPADSGVDYFIARIKMTTAAAAAPFEIGKTYIIDRKLSELDLEGKHRRLVLEGKYARTETFGSSLYHNFTHENRHLQSSTISQSEIDNGIVEITLNEIE